MTALCTSPEDWFWCAGLPGFVYATLAITAVILPAHPRSALFAVAASAITLLLIGIHNAWDTVTHIVVSSAHSHANSPN